MANWKKVLVSGSNANLTALQVDNLTSGEVVIGGGGSNLSTTAINGSGNILGTTGATGVVMSGSFSGSFQGDGSNLTGVGNTLTIDADTGGTSTVTLESQTLDIAGTANEIETSVSGQTITVGLPNDVTIGNDLTVVGDLTVNGTASFQNTENLLVADRFVLFASGSVSTGDGGIVVQQATQDVGELYGYDSGTGRWGFTSSFSADGTGFTPSVYVGTVQTGTGQTGGSAAPIYGGSGNGYGTIHIDTDDGEIWIYS